VLANNLKFKTIDDSALYTQMAIITLKNSHLSTVVNNFLEDFSLID